jgi:hypothetical protein
MPLFIRGNSSGIRVSRGFAIRSASILDVVEAGADVTRAQRMNET